ncbi:MAG: beta-lactamase family protein [Acidobacteriaceae bacterium]|nr:beta-lactamase family protein [Acidobacteriaceae bacterium]
MIELRQFRVLYRDFLRRIVDLELLSVHAHGDAATLFGQFISLLIFLTLLFSVPAVYFDGKMAVPGQVYVIEVWTIQHFLIATTMLLAGLFAVLTWNSVFPDKHDLLILAPLPVRTRTLFLAKIAAVASALGLLILALHALAGVVWPFAFNRHVPAQTLPEFAAQPALPPASASRIEAVMNRDFESLQRSGIFARAGVAMGVVTHSERRIFTYGTAKPDSIFEIASLTKTFTALTLAQMAQQGLVELNEPVRLLLPPGTVEKPTGGEITLLDLATQHSGLPRMPADFHPLNKDDAFADFHRSDLYDYFISHGLSKPADATFLYSNLGVGLLGQVLADRAHTSYAELVKAEITAPLGLKDTAVDLSPEQWSRFIQGHNGATEGPDGFSRFSHAYGDRIRPWHFDAIAGAGALHSTAVDMLSYVEANLHPKVDGGALSAALLESQRLRADVDDSAFTAEAFPAGTRIGLIWLHTPDGCYFHDGASAGHTSFAFFNPRDDYAGIVLSNGFIPADLIGLHLRQRLAGLPALSLAPVAIPASGGFAALIRVFAAYWITMLAASSFMYCGVLGLQGVAAYLLPRQWFLRLASSLQLTVFCVLVSVYFLQPNIAAPNPFDVHSSGLPAWSPSYWFLGLFQQLNGSPALASYASRAWIALMTALAGTAAAYLVSYFSGSRKIIEQPDIQPAGRRQLLLPRFGTSLGTAIVQFSIRTLLRSRQHRLILAFYLGVGFSATVFLLKSPLARQLTRMTVIRPWHEHSVPLLAASIILISFWTLGMRSVFSLPLDLRANWIFRMTPVCSGSDCVKAMRLSLWILSLAPAWFTSAVVLLTLWPLRPAIEHLVLLALFGITLAEFCLMGTLKIPFTCSWLPGKSKFHIAFWLCILFIVEIVLQVADLERRALDNPALYAIAFLFLSAFAAFAIWRSSRSAEQDIERLQFEEAPSWQLTSLNLPT